MLLQKRCSIFTDKITGSFLLFNLKIYLLLLLGQLHMLLQTRLDNLQEHNSANYSKSIVHINWEKRRFPFDTPLLLDTPEKSICSIYLYQKLLIFQIQ